MQNQPLVRSLEIKGLFGTHDLEIEFKKLTVIVGKNGLGKTTLLKIINGLLKNDEHVDYDEICKSLTLHLGDGNNISYGDFKEHFVKESTTPDFIKEVSKLVSLNEETLENLKEIATKKNKDINDVVYEMLRVILSQESVHEQAAIRFHTEYDKHHKKIFTKTARSDDFNVRYISTVDISANADKNINPGNSIELNVLNVAINYELNNLLKSNKEHALSRFMHCAGDFLSESGKTVKLHNNEIHFQAKNNNELSLSQLSSGERQLVYILATAANTAGRPTLFLMDEPEISLHLSWQGKIIDAIIDINPDVQIIAVTHSPGIIMNGHMDAYVEMNDILKEA